jgi:hypothetical protein
MRNLVCTFTLLVMVMLSGCGSGGTVEHANKPSVALATSNGSVFVIKAANFNGVAGIEISITYDSSTLSSPIVTPGGFVPGAMFAANTNIPGTIKIAVISTQTYSGNGEIATVSFANANSDAGVFPVVSAKFIDATGAEIL